MKDPSTTSGLTIFCTWR